MSKPLLDPVFFSNARAFRSWLSLHGTSRTELIVGFHKVGTGVPSLTWPESVDEALCFGWIDGVRTRIDENTYKIRFTPRRRDSIWSAVNIAKAIELQAQGRMRPSGLAAFEHRTQRKSTVYSYEQTGAAELTAGQTREFKRNRVAWEYWQSSPPSYRRTLTHWIVSASKESTKARRLARLVEACGAGLRLPR